jgi:hypothetical protein
MRRQPEIGEKEHPVTRKSAHCPVCSAKLKAGEAKGHLELHFAAGKPNEVLFPLSAQQFNELTSIIREED